MYVTPKSQRLKGAEGPDGGTVVNMLLGEAAPRGRALGSYPEAAQRPGPRAG